MLALDGVFFRGLDKTDATVICRDVFWQGLPEIAEMVMPIGSPRAFYTEEFSLDPLIIQHRAI